ncbi:unnamed protein product [Cunninghamella echinulata]
MSNEELSKWLEQEEAFLSQFISGKEPILETNTPLLNSNRNYIQKLGDNITSTRNINYSINSVNLQKPFSGYTNEYYDA